MTRLQINKQIIGIDVGGVIIDRERNDDTDTSLFSPNYLNAYAVEGAEEGITRLSQGTFRDAIWIVSKCGKEIERKTREWLKHHKFDAIVPEARWRFCRDRADKAPIAKELGLTHFVDDKLEVLHHMHKIVEHRLLFRPIFGQIGGWWGDSTSGVRIWMNWEEMAASLEGDGKEASTGQKTETQNA